MVIGCTMGVVRQDLIMEKTEDHFQNQMLSACISRIQSNNGCDGNPSQYHSPTVKNTFCNRSR